MTSTCFRISGYQLIVNGSINVDLKSLIAKDTKLNSLSSKFDDQTDSRDKIKLCLAMFLQLR